MSGSRDVFNLVRAAFLTNIMVPKSKNLDFGPEIKDSWCFLDFWDSDFPNSFRKNRSPMAPQGKPLWWKWSYGSCSFQVFVKKCRKYLFLPIRFRFFMITLFSPFVRLRPVQAGFRVSNQALIFRVIEKNKYFIWSLSRHLHVQ